MDFRFPGVPQTGGRCGLLGVVVFYVKEKAGKARLQEAVPLCRIFLCQNAFR